MAETDDKESRELAIRLLLEEYKARGDEIKEFNQRYHQQTSYLYVVLSAIIAIAIAGIKADKDASTSIAFFGTYFASIDFLLLMFIIFSPPLAFFLYSSIMDSMQMLFINGMRRSAIEKKLNIIAGQDLLVWDSRIIPVIRSHTNSRIGWWIRPGLLQSVWMSVYYTLAAIFLSILSYSILGSIFVVYFLANMALLIFHSYQWVSLNSLVLSRTREIILAESDLAVGEKMADEDADTKNFYQRFTQGILVSGYGAWLMAHQSIPRGLINRGTSRKPEMTNLEQPPGDQQGEPSKGTT